MSRFLITSMPIRSHVLPATAIARVLIDRGHEVGWYTGRRFKKKVESLGCRFFPMNLVVDLDHTHIDEIYPERAKLKGIKQLKWDMKHVFVDAAIIQFEDLTDIQAVFKADVILSDPSTLGPMFLQTMGGPPVANYGLLNLVMSSRDTAPFGPGIQPKSASLGHLRNKALTWFFYDVVMRDVQTYYNDARVRIGLQPVKYHMLDSHKYESRLYLQGTTPSFEYPRSDMPKQVRFIGPILPDPPIGYETPSWWGELEDGKPVVLVSQGVIDLDYNNLLIPAIEGLSDEDLLVIALTGGRPIDEISLTAMPSNVRTATFVPFHLILPYVDVMVSSGGYGSVHFALAHGVPLVTAGIEEGKAEVCARVHWSGSGINLKTDKPKPRQVKDAVLRVLSDASYENNAKRIAAEFATHDAPLEAGKLLEELAAS